MTALNIKVLLLLVFVGGVFCRFEVDYEKNCFLKDGECFRYISGSIHYFRVPADLWEDRIYKMKMAGLNAIQTYVEWSGHEPEPGKYNFKLDYDLPRFLQIAQKQGMLVILRPGPFIDAERDMGGLPYWLLREDPDIKLRTMDETYLKYMDRWFNILLPIIEPFLYNNGGPIITVQIENEYGSFGCDSQYKTHIRDLFKKVLKNNVVLFTTDGSSMNGLTCGKTDEVLSTIDFGSGANVTYNFEMLRWTQSSGPLVNSEFYPGWLDHWGQPHAQVSSDSIVKTLTEMLQANASVNVYMFHGGTSFGFTAGSNIIGTFQACPTSYDYDAPLNEAGDPTPKYYAMRDAISKFTPVPEPAPKPALKMSLPPIKMKKVVSLWELISSGRDSINSTYPLSFENISHPYGFVLYSTVVSFVPTSPALLTVKGIADRAHVYVDKVLQGILSREQKIESLPIKVLKGQKIDILVENQGRVCFGSGINDRKGIFQNVTLGSQTLLNWTITPIKLLPGDIQKINQMKTSGRGADGISYPAFYTATIQIKRTQEILDTYLKLDGWQKGVAFLNSYNLGRYWPEIGPQVTLYTPKVFFGFGSNSIVPFNDTITVFELENAPCSPNQDCFVEFVDTPIINGTTPF